MKNITVSIVVAASILTAGYSFAQDDEEQPAIDATSVEASEGANQENRFKRDPIDLAQFSKLDSLKSADANGDGTLSREEIEDYALKQIVKRMADRMERRLDVNGDGTVTIAEIERQKEKEFAALDRNEDGKLDRSEMRAGKKSGKNGGHGGHRFHHGIR